MPELINDPQEIRLNEQQEIRQIMGEPPGWIVRWGNSLVLICATMLFLVAYWVKYPDTIPLPLILQTENPPIRIPAPATSKIDVLAVREGEPVEEGQTLVRFESPANAADMEKLEELLAEISLRGITSKLDLPNNLKLGSIQSTWSSFSENYKDYLFFINRNQTKKRLDILNDKIYETQKLNDVLQKRKTSLLQQRKIKAKTLNRYKELLLEKAVSKVTVENLEAEYIALRSTIEDLQAEYISNELAIQGLEEQKLNLRIDKDKNGNDKMIRLEEDVQKLRSEVDRWKLAMLLKAPIAGTIAFSRPLAENEFVNSGEELMTIVPEGDSTGQIIGLGTLATQGAGKVEVGQRVNIQVDNYPFEEFGILRGNVKSIARIPQERNYLVEVELQDSLVTTYGEVLDFRQQMSGTADIITRERRYLFRLFDKLRSSWKNR